MRWNEDGATKIKKWKVIKRVVLDEEQEKQENSSACAEDEYDDKAHYSVDYTRTILDTQLDNWLNHTSQRSPAGIIL